MPFSQIVLGILLSFAICAAVVCVRGLLLAPVKGRQNTDVCWLVHITGEAEGLEEAVRGIMWLRDAGRTSARVLIAADGLTPEAERKLDIIAQRCGGTVFPAEKMQEVLEETVWRDPDIR